MTSRTKRSWGIPGFAFCAVALLATAPAPGQPGETRLHSGACATVEVPGQLVLPDGTSPEDAGVLTICLERWLSPVSGIHTLQVRGRPVGMILSRIGRDPQATARQPVVVFDRNVWGEARLVGYAWPEEHSMLAMVFQAVGRQPDPSLADPAKLVQVCEDSDRYLLVAALAR